MVLPTHLAFFWENLLHILKKEKAKLHGLAHCYLACTSVLVVIFTLIVVHLQLYLDFSLNKFNVFPGPVVSALTNKYGCRAVCMAGSFLGAAAFVLSTFSTSVNMLMMTYGVMGGACNILDCYVIYLFTL